MPVTLVRRLVVTQTTVLDDVQAAALLDEKGVVCDERLAEIEVSWQPADELVEIAVRIEDADSALAFFRRLAIEKKPGHWFLPIREPGAGGRSRGYGAIVVPQGRRWLSATQDEDPRFASQVCEHDFHDDLAEAQCRAVSLFFEHTQPADI